MDNEAVKELTKSINRTIEAEGKKQYRRGYVKGLRAYAWWKNGVQYVGSCDKTLKEALLEIPL